MRGERWRHLRHGGDAADVPVVDVLVKDRRRVEHGPVRPHAPHGMSKRGGKQGRKDTPSGHNTRLCCAVKVAVALASASCAHGISGMAGPYGCGDGGRA